MVFRVCVKTKVIGFSENLETTKIIGTNNLKVFSIAFREARSMLEVFASFARTFLINTSGRGYIRECSSNGI